MKKVNKIIFILALLIVFIAPFFILEKVSAAIFEDTPDELYLPKDSYDKSKEAEADANKELYKLFLKGESEADPPQETPSLTGGATPNPTPSAPQQTPEGTPINQTYANLSDFKDYVGEKTGVPLCVLEAISYIEYPTVWDYTPEQFNNYIQPGAVIPNCPLNLCSASGHMQMTTGIDDRGDTTCGRCGAGYCPNAWASYGNAVNQYDSATHTPNVCNLRDSEFAAAKKLKTDSGTDFSNRNNWQEEAYMRAGTRYYGSCSSGHSYDFNTRGFPQEVPTSLTYCEFLQFVCSL